MNTANLSVLTWRAHDDRRLEQVRIQRSGARLKAYGRIIVAGAPSAFGDPGAPATVGGSDPESPGSPAADGFSVSYDLVTDDDGRTKRISLHVMTSAGDRQLSLTRDTENYWMVHRGHAEDRPGEVGGSRVQFGGAENVDVTHSPFFNALTYRVLPADTSATVVPLVYIELPSLELRAVEVEYARTGPNTVRINSPLGPAEVSFDADGFVLEYPDLATRI